MHMYVVTCQLCDLNRSNWNLLLIRNATYMCYINNFSVLNKNCHYKQKDEIDNYVK